MTVTIPAREFARLVDRVTAIVPDDPVPVPVLRNVHAWTADGRLLMEATDRHVLLRTRHTADTDDADLDTLIRAEHLTVARRAIPDPTPVPETDWEDSEAWITTVDPAKDWTVTIRASDDGEHVHITIHGDTEVTITDETRPLSEWPPLDAIWANTRVTAGQDATCYNPQLLAGLLRAAPDGEPAVIWHSGGECRATVVTLGPDTVALIMPVVLGTPDVIDPVPDPRDGWPGLLADGEEGQA
ncbi:hypothetical protein [Actinomyces procaprae]|uniref:hypothetical protein n=1 Tax=Actinomyces procaprae TaxID=2560010 RepID=UPI0010A24E14|nr:hypothetical protein [Actinomyces procaprae]